MITICVPLRFLKMPLTEIKDGMRKEIKEHEEKIKSIEVCT